MAFHHVSELQFPDRHCVDFDRAIPIEPAADAHRPSVLERARRFTCTIFWPIREYTYFAMTSE